MFNIKLVHRNGIDFRVPVDNFCRFRFDNPFDAASSKQSTQAKTGSQTDALNKALDIYGPTLGQGQQSFPGDRVAPMTETQTQASDVQGFLDKFSPYRDMPMFGETGTALQGLLSGKTGASPISQQQTDEYFKGAIEDPRRRAFAENDLPAINEAFAGPGYWSGARAGEVTDKTRDLSDFLGTQRSQLNWDVGQANRGIEEAKAGRALSAIGPGLQYGQAPTQNDLANLQDRAGVFDLAGAPQRQQQAEINSAIQKFAEENRLTDPEDLQILMALLGMNFSSGSGSSIGAGLGYQAISGFAGGFGQGAGAAAGASAFG